MHKYPDFFIVPAERGGGLNQRGDTGLDEGACEVRKAASGGHDARPRAARGEVLTRTTGTCLTTRSRTSLLAARLGVRLSAADQPVRRSPRPCAAHRQRDGAGGLRLGGWVGSAAARWQLSCPPEEHAVGGSAGAVCDRLVINALPSTAAEFEQLKGRLWRQGQSSKRVDVIIPRTGAEVHGQHWSWCESCLARLRFKASLADAGRRGCTPRPAQEPGTDRSGAARLARTPRRRKRRAGFPKTDRSPTPGPRGQARAP